MPGLPTPTDLCGTRRVVTEAGLAAARLQPPVDGVHGAASSEVARTPAVHHAGDARISCSAAGPLAGGTGAVLGGGAPRRGRTSPFFVHAVPPGFFKKIESTEISNVTNSSL